MYAFCFAGGPKSKILPLAIFNLPLAYLILKIPKKCPKVKPLYALFVPIYFMLNYGIKTEKAKRQDKNFNFKFKLPFLFVPKKKQKASGLNAPKPLLRGKPLRTPVRYYLLFTSSTIRKKLRMEYLYRRRDSELFRRHG